MRCSPRDDFFLGPDGTVVIEQGVVDQDEVDCFTKSNNLEPTAVRKVDVGEKTHQACGALPTEAFYDRGTAAPFGQPLFCLP